MERNIRLNWPELVSEAVKRRKQQKLTQKQLAVLVGVSGPTVNSFEQGRTGVTLESCLKILRFLGLLIENLTLFESEYLAKHLQNNKAINSYFINLKESGNFVEPIEEAFKLCQLYLDKDFKKLFPLENDFFPRLWELYVCNTLIQSNKSDQLQVTKGQGPDFLLSNFFEGKNLYIECVCPQDADSQKKGNLIENKSFTYSQEKTSYGNLEGYSAQSEGFDEFIVSRYSSSIHDKSEKFKKSYQYTEKHYRVLCVSGYMLSLLKGERHASFDRSLSTKEDFETVIRGKREYYFSKNGEDGFRDKQLNLSKGDNTIINLGHHEDLATFDAIIFSDYFPFLTNTSGNIYSIYPNKSPPTEFIKNLQEIFIIHQ